MKKIFKNKILAIILIFIVIINCSSNILSFAAQKGDVHLQKIGEAPYHLKYYREDREIYTYLICSIIGYYENGSFYPAYCMNRDLPGAEKGEYDVYLKEVLSNHAVWRVVKNGYPYKTYTQMGLTCMEDAFAVTKMAIYCVLGQSNINYFSVDENDAVGQKMLEVLRNLVNIGLNGTEKIQDEICTIEKYGELEKQGEFYYQNYKINKLIEAKSFKIEVLENKDIQIVESNDEIYKVKIPENLLLNDIDIKFKIIADIKNYPVFYGETKIPGTQNYVVTSDGYLNIEQILESKIKTNISKVEILKQDKQTKLPISNTKINIYKEDGSLIDCKVTDKNGKIIFDNLYTGKYIIKEIEANSNYILEEKQIEVGLNYCENKNIIIENQHKTGKVEIIKYDKDNINLTLGGIEFELYNEKNELIDKYITDLNGQIKINDLNIGKYTLKEVMAKNGYEIAEDIEFEIKYNETTKIEISNEKTKGRVKVIKVDKEDNEIRLKDVEFNIVDSIGNVVDKLVTDKNGEAVSKLLPIYKENYTLVETKTNEAYILNEEEIKIELSPYVEKNVIVENEVKKGKIKIIKLDFDNFKPIENVKFDIINKSTGDVIETLITDKNGEAISSNLSINKEYKIVEREKLEGYKLNLEEYEVKLKWNEVIEITITNEKEDVEQEEKVEVPVEVEIPKKLPKTGY